MCCLPARGSTKTICSLPANPSATTTAPGWESETKGFMVQQNSCCPSTAHITAGTAEVTPALHGHSAGGAVATAAPLSYNRMPCPGQSSAWSKAAQQKGQESNLAFGP